MYHQSMGVYFPTCCVSNLPILDGEKAVQLLLVPGKVHPHKEAEFPTLGAYEGAAHGPTSFYRPHLWPIFGTHNSYGGLYPLHDRDPSIKVASRGLFEDLLFQEVKRTETANPKEDDPKYISYGTTPLSEFLEERSLLFKHPVKIWTPYGLMPLYSTLVRRDVWDALVSMRINEIHEGAKKYLKSLTVLDNAKEMLQRSTEIQHGDNLFCNLAYDFGLTTLDQYLAKLPFEDALEVVEALVEMLHVNAYLEMTRRHWQPMTGAGSQDLDLDEHVRFINMLKSTATKLAAKIDESG